MWFVYVDLHILISLLFLMFLLFLFISREFQHLSKLLCKPHQQKWLINELKTSSDHLAEININLVQPREYFIFPCLPLQT